MLGYRWKYAHTVMPLWSMIPLYILYQTGFALFASWVVLKHQLPPGISKFACLLYPVLSYILINEFTPVVVVVVLIAYSSNQHSLGNDRHV